MTSNDALVEEEKVEILDRLDPRIQGGRDFYGPVAEGLRPESEPLTGGILGASMIQGGRPWVPS